MRRTPQEAAKFFPRPPGSAPYVYREPPVSVDGWETARAGDLGLDEAAITRMVQSIIDGDPAARRPSLIHSMLVAYRGKLVLDEYFFGFERDQPHDLALRRQDVLLRPARRRDQGRREDRARYEDLRLMSARGPVRQSRPAQVRDHARASPDAFRRARLQRQRRRLARQRGHDAVAVRPAGLVEVHARSADGTRSRQALCLLLGEHQPGGRRAHDRDRHLAAGALRAESRASRFSSASGTGT